MKATVSSSGVSRFGGLNWLGGAVSAVGSTFIALDFFKIRKFTISK